MDTRDSNRSMEDLQKKASASKRAEESSKRRKAKSPPNPFMSRLNIASFLDLMMADKNDQTYSKGRKNPTGNNFPLITNTVKLPKDSSQSSNNVTTNHSAGLGTATNGTNFIDLYNSCLTSCPVCANDISDLLMSSYTSCSHVACISCWQCYVINRIENYELGYGFSCLTCSAELPYHNIVEIIKLTNDDEYLKKLLLRLENFYLERTLIQDSNLRWCPNPGCGFGFILIPDFSDCPKLSKCQLRSTCNGHLCNNHCVDFWKTVAHHDCMCQTRPLQSSNPLFHKHHSSLSMDFRSSKVDVDDNISIQNNVPTIHDGSNKSDRSRNLWLRCFPWRRNRNKNGSREYKSRRKHGRGDDVSLTKSPISQIEADEIVSLASIRTSSSRTKFHHSSDQIQSEGEVKTCPKCHTYVLKMNDGSCNHMVCVVCGCEFCWLCMRQITDMHYLSPSGCTFWGRRQWNVEKRALWQLGTLIGAPVAIGFLAALAIPAMVIGIPLYVGRKIHGALKTKNKDRKRTIAVAGGIGAFIVSPVIAAVAVGLGVPLILAYVYVVMPIALCRASACSCDDNIPPQDEVDFSDITTVAPQELIAVTEQNCQPIPNESLEIAVITRVPLEENNQVNISNSDNDSLRTPLQRVMRSSFFSYHAIRRRDPGSGMCESLSTSHLPEIGGGSMRMIKSGYSDPVSMSKMTDVRSCYLQ